ncbi:MAG TPA: cohesin domain-containing protein [Candidatus Angelobacter sp.]|nr:cohesin domain-containing protein [Candidatus Angelobacter sp.]
MRKVTASLTFLFIFAALLSAAESAKSLFQKGVKAEARQDYEAAFDFYKAAYQQKPEDLKYRVPFERTRQLASASKIKRGQKLREQGNLPEALALFQQALEVDPSNDLAAQEVRRTQLMMQKTAGGSAGASISPGRQPDEEDPLRKRLEGAAGPVALAQFPDAAPLTAIEMTDDSKVLYETIGKLGNINVLFDPDYTSRRLPIKLKNVNLQEALDILALESRTFWRPVTPNTIFVAQDTQAKRRELEQNVVKTFYLGNVSAPTDLQDMVNAIRTVLEVQRIQQIPSQSAIVIKGTPDQLALASKMIDDIDKSKPEVIVDVVVAQVRRDKLRNLGITPPQNMTIALQGTNTTTTGSGGTTTTSSGSGLNFNDLQHLNSTNYAVTIDPVKLIAIYSDDDTKIIQNPKVRATDNEKATLTIADKIPIATGSFGTPLGVGTAVGSVGVNTQFTYTDVGVKMEITPRVHPDGQITLKTSMEISNVTGQSTIGGVTQPIISTRKVEHTIRLMDGETNLMGGILEVQDTNTVAGTPFLGQIPVLKYLFTSTKKQHTTNELVFLLIPHIVRSQELNDLNRRTFDVGTGSGIDLRMASKPGNAAPAVSTGAPQQPAGGAPVTPARQPANLAQPQQQPPQQPPPQQQGTPAAPQTLKPGQVGLRIEPGALQQQQGGTFSLTVVLSHGQDIASVPIQISYDPKVLQFVSVTNGDFLAKDGQNVVLVHRDDASTGKLQVTAQRPPGVQGVSGDGTVFNLTFTAKAKGTGTVSISVPGARSSQNQPQDVLGSQTTVTVN